MKTEGLCTSDISLLAHASLLSFYSAETSDFDQEFAKGETRADRYGLGPGSDDFEERR